MIKKQVKLITALFFILFVFFAEKIKSQLLIKSAPVKSIESPAKSAEEILPSGLKAYGIDLEINFTDDLLYNISGGIKTGPAYIGLFYPNINVDFSKIFGWNGTRMYISSIGNIGNNFKKK